ncbi:hypothetical protein ATCV1_z202L [Acanthocystis turfacea chlorella virus 1]|uniref:Uncharacterized protein z202L n=1 Tax=Chlorovirus heliozoae TaxID=322019 RepID=A7K8G2_9PHYC|nr:hypothetical protein ATCV1_z202L [Acanthocystis turfacea chlorella virus 1]ABT16336.1 hypothetical protein ATCV1_z202L [Acanthocystis turfacea chlorella virus 1]
MTSSYIDKCNIKRERRALMYKWYTQFPGVCIRVIADIRLYLKIVLQNTRRQRSAKIILFKEKKHILL